MSIESSADLLALHGVRLRGFATTDAVARRFALDPERTDELLLDYQAYGWVGWSEFAGTSGWSLTETGRVENHRQLTDELGSADDEPATAVRCVHRDFLPLNERLQRACTDWQLKPSPEDPLSVNDHMDATWDGRVLMELSALDRELRPLVHRLRSVVTRFDGYDRRFSAALERAEAGDPSWVDRTDADSCHVVWFELHEDLVATLGVERSPT